MDLDFSKLSRNEMIVAGGVLGTLISSVLPWFSAGPVSINGGSLMWLGVLLIIGGGAVLLMKSLDVQDVTINQVSAEQLAMVLVGAGTVFFLLKLLIGQQFWGRSWGMFFGILAAGATLYGAYSAAQEKGISLPSADDFTGPGDGDGEATTF